MPQPTFAVALLSFVRFGSHHSYHTCQGTQLLGRDQSDDLYCGSTLEPTQYLEIIQMIDAVTEDANGPYQWTKCKGAAL
jgi:hypothetical protein